MKTCHMCLQPTNAHLDGCPRHKNPQSCAYREWKMGRQHGLRGEPVHEGHFKLSYLVGYGLGLIKRGQPKGATH